MASTSLSLTPTAVSCPAKVLVAGGYLVLDRDYTGLVFGLDARIHTVIEPIKTKSGVTISQIVVTSPQFREAIWEYGYRAETGDGGMAVTQLSVYVLTSVHGFMFRFHISFLFVHVFFSAQTHINMSCHNKPSIP